MSDELQAAVDLLSQFVSDICSNPAAAKYDEDGLCKSCGNLVGSHAIATVLAALAQAQRDSERLERDWREACRLAYETGDVRVAAQRERDTPLRSACLDWWRGRRPVGWTEDDHLATPHINCVTEIERALAGRCAIAIRAQQD